MTDIKPDRTLSNVPDGMQPVVLARLVEDRLKTHGDDPVAVVFVARDGRRMQRMAEILEQLMPGHPVLQLPAWDCLPYDRVSPNGVTIAARMTTISSIASGAVKGAIVLTTVNALVQKLPPLDMVRGMSFSAAAGQVVDSEKLIAWAAGNGYLRVPTVREQGEYAVRGGLVDLFPAGAEAPMRFDFFGRQLESIRTFDPDTQRTNGNLKRMTLAPMTEVLLTEDGIRRFRQRYTATFGGNTVDDPLYAAVSAGQRYPGVEHWLAFFYDHLDHLTAYTGEAPMVFDDQAREAFTDRQSQIADYYQAREEARHEKNATGAAPYKPVKPAELYEMEQPLYALAPKGGVIQLSPFLAGDVKKGDDAGGRVAPSFAAERQSQDVKFELCRRAPVAGRELVRGGGEAAQGRAEEEAPHHHCLLVGRLARPHGAGAEGSWARASAPCRELARCRDDLARHYGHRDPRARNRLPDRRPAGTGRAGHSGRAPAAAKEAQEGLGCADRGGEPRRGRPRGACRPRYRPLPRAQDHRGLGRAA